MNTISRWSMALALLSGAAYGQQPPNVVVSDAYFNTAMGTNALISNGSGGCLGPFSACNLGNTAAGYDALYSNTAANWNTAVGVEALYSNTSMIANGGTFEYTSGDANTAVGYQALYSNLISSNNTAIGYQALYSNTALPQPGLLVFGGNNTASGAYTLYANTTGSDNTADGLGALQLNTTGWGNTASGLGALYSNRTGTVNIGLGYQAGSKLTTGSHNIEIGNVGAASDNNTIKIGTDGQQAKTFIAGIYNTSVNGSAVMVNSVGQLGVVVSSERFKTAIAPMGSNTEKLQQLRPVSFHLKTDPNGAVQYGLIAEEVAKVYPELVVRDQNGRIDGVRYDELAPMLLKEVQKQAAEIRDLKKLVVEMQAGLAKLQSKDELVAQR
jgi:hypothetical protein